MSIFCEWIPTAVLARQPRGTAIAVGLPLYILHQVLRIASQARDDGDDTIRPLALIGKTSAAAGMTVAGDTIGGLIFNTLEHAPRRGEAVRLGDYTLVVVDVSGSRIVRVRVRECAAPEPRPPDRAGCP